MIDLFLPIRSFFKFGSVCTDNNIFRLHYKATVIMLLVFTLLVTSKQFFGEPIHCMTQGHSDENKEAINNYCWIYGTYTLKSRFLGKEGKDMAYLGVGPEKGKQNEQLKHTYYQWVCFVLLGQAMMFYTPRYLWKIWEGGRLKALASDLASPLMTKDWSEFRRGELVDYLTYTHVYTHNMYAIRYAFCEILNLINVVGQIFLLDFFLDGAFRGYGAAVTTFTNISKAPTNFHNYESVNPMDAFFPKLTKCFIRMYGPSGNIEVKDRLCVLPLNIINEKIFVILWFWLIFLAVLSSAAVFFRIIILCMPHLRTYLIMGQVRHVKFKVISKLVKRYSVGDWFLLYMLGKNMNPIMYKELIIELSKGVESNPHMI